MPTTIYLGTQHFRSEQPKEALLAQLAAHFKGFERELQVGLEFFEKVDSARQYGLVEADIDQEALENLRELIRRLTPIT